jgi:hypothetical protein
MKRHVSAYLEAIFRFTNAGYIETNVGTVWLDVEISSHILYASDWCFLHILPRLKLWFIKVVYMTNKMLQIHNILLL